MKETLLKIIFVAVLSLSVINKARAMQCAANILQPRRVMSVPSQEPKRFSCLLAMETQQNLKAYHLGLKAVFAHYHIPSANDLLKTIRSHSNFLGTLAKNEALDRFSRVKLPFFIFEEKDMLEPHFYVVRGGGMRHFTVDKGEYAGIDNISSIKYPSFSRFLKSTVAF